MRITPELIQWADEYGDQNLSPAERISKSLRLLEDIEKDRDFFISKIREEEQRHKQVLNEVRNQRLVLLEKCPHPKPFYHYQGDPSGGTDRSYRCDLCGESW